MYFTPISLVSLHIFLFAAGDHLRGDRNESHCGENGRRCTEEYIPNSYKMLVDLVFDDDVDTVDISRQGELYSCLPACFQENVGNKCDMCLVDTANNIWCDNQEVGRGCVNRCCEYEGDASNANTRETENGRTIPSSYEMLVDLFLDDDVDTVDISRQGDLYSCLPACFQENVGNKCDMCLVDTANNIWCDDQDVGRGCVNRCCEYEGDASNANTRETENGKMITSSYKMLVDLLLDDNADTVDISRQGNLYSCFPACFQENVGHKCDMCLVDTANNIWCDNQEVGRGCVNRCCEYQGEASSNNIKKTKNGRAIPSSYEMLVDLDLDYDIDTIDINRQDELFSCLPSCFEDNVGSDCDMCLVDTANNIWCEDQEVGLECGYSCCDYIGDASDDNTEKTKNGKIIPSSYEKMVYLDDDTIVTIRQGELYSCLSGCVEENIGSKCDMCLIDTEDDIWCDNQEVDRGCIRRCCASEGSL